MTLYEDIEKNCTPLDGWTTIDRLKMMADLIKQQQPELVVELGVFGGRSFIAQALALADNGHGVIVGVDPWRKAAAVEGENDTNAKWWSSIDIESIHRQCMNAMWENQLEEYAVVMRAESQHAAKAFFVHHIDILNIDANHSEVASCRDVSLWLPLVKPGGFIWMDDCDWPSTKKAQELIEQSCDIIMDNGHWKKYRKL